MDSQKTYIVAVSGGVDSVVLLHKLISYPAHPKPMYIVAHFDHGIRDDSAYDVEFVRKLAKQYGLAFESERVELGSGVSEHLARQARYDFLEKVKEKYRAEAIITAHHQDDVLETMILNILRGTSPRGLIGFTRPGALRPLMAKTKQELIDYAHEHGLKWREDSTNQDEKYLRNYVRLKLMPKLKQQRKKLLEIRELVLRNYQEIDLLVQHLMAWCMNDSREIRRSRFVVLPFKVQRELMATCLREASIEINQTMVERAVLAVKTVPAGKQIELSRDAKLYTYRETVLLKIDPEHV